MLKGKSTSTNFQLKIFVQLWFEYEADIAILRLFATLELIESLS